MRRARPWRLLLAGACLAALAAGCGGEKKEADPLTFEQLPDTAGLSSGPAVVDSFRVERMDGGALRVSGRARLPDGTKVQIAVRPEGGGSSLAMTHAIVTDDRFESPPLTGDMGPLPPDTYRFEVLAHFTPDWQTADVLRATGDGKALRGPGITRSRQGDAAFYLMQEAKR